MGRLDAEQAEHDFYRAHTRALLSKIAALVSLHSEDLLPFEAAKKLLKPEGEVYEGLTAVPLDRIVGSEGRYRDFNRHFLPRREHLKQRWVSIDRTRYQDIILPPIRLYKMGGVYFVRDGNHRVSVARSSGQLEIDAEVTSLQSRIAISPDMDLAALKRAVIEYEKALFFESTGYLSVTGTDDIDFSEPGRFDTVREHILVHKYYLNQSQPAEIGFGEALWSWHENVYAPMVLAIEEEHMLGMFPGRTAADLYLFLVRHWDELKAGQQGDVGIGEAVRDFKRSSLESRQGPFGILRVLRTRFFGKDKKK